MPSAPISTAGLRIFHVQNALDDERSGPFRTKEIQIPPADRRIKVVAHPGEEVLKPRVLPQHRRDIAKLVRSSTDPHIPGPARPRNRLGEPSDRAPDPWRTGKPRAIVAIARPRHRHVDSKYKRRTTSLTRLCEQVAHEAAVADHVELKPDWPGNGSRHFSDWTCRDRRQAKRNARHLRGARCLTLAAACDHAGQSDWRECDRHRKPLAEQLGRKIEARNVAQNALAKEHSFQIGDIPLECHLGVRAAIYIVEQEFWQTPPSELAIVEGGCRFHAAASARLASLSQRSR